MHANKYIGAPHQEAQCGASTPVPRVYPCRDGMRLFCKQLIAIDESLDHMMSLVKSSRLAYAYMYMYRR